jgi:serine/threonine protein kinase
MEHPQIRGLSEWRPLARGRLAVVWEARQLPLDRLVAVKVYHRELDEGDRRRFLRESAAGGLSYHPGIVTTHDAGILPDDRPYLIMELRSGRSLAEWLKPENRPSEEQVRQAGVRIADALAAAHASGMLHRNVNPANILLDRYGDPGLADFGLAVVEGSEDTGTDRPRLNPAYAPPEAFLMQPATRSGDVYSLAATLYALLAGRPARQVNAAPIPLEQMIDIANQPVDRLPGVNPQLMDVLLIALSNDPAARPTAATFRELLANVPALGPVVSEPSAEVGEKAPSRPLVVAAAAKAAPPASGSPESDEDAPPSERRRRLGLLGLVAALVTLIASATAWLVSEPASSGVPAAPPPSATSGVPSPSAASSASASPRPATPSTTPGGGDVTGSDSSAEQVIRLEDPPRSAESFETIRIRGTYHGGPSTFLRVQRWENDSWRSFPLPTRTDESGNFTAHVELGQPGRYRLRLVDVDSGMTSEPFVLVIRG